MFKYCYKILIYILFLNILSVFNLSAEIIKDFKIYGNQRVSSETIIMFSDINIGDDITKNDLNTSLKKLYETNFFKDISLQLIEGIINIKVEENPIIENISFKGIKANKYLDPILDKINLKSRSSFNEILLQEDKNIILLNLKNFGFYFAKLETYIEHLDDNKINLVYDINVGEKAKIKKISFIGDKVFKDIKLRSIIVSEEYKFWKFISGKKFLNENLIELDNRLLKNFYLNEGYYLSNINSSYAKLINNNDFELIFNIKANRKFYFGDVTLSLPSDYDPKNFNDLSNLLEKLSGSEYSLNAIDKILKEIDKISLTEEFQSIKAQVQERIVGENKIDLKFIIEETDKYFVEKINILGNNITRENVIRNQLVIDEGDYFNELLHSRSINNLKSLNFFKNVKSEIIDNNENFSKSINIIVEEKPTGEISAGAGVGTSGGTFGFSIKENNFMGKGIGLDTNLTVDTDSIKGQFSINNQNFLNSDKSLNFKLESSETDHLKDFGYKNNKTGFSLATNFEYYDDIFVSLGTSNFYEKIETDSTASSRMQLQQGNYWDTFLELGIDLDKRNQKFKTSDGYRSSYYLDLPIISEKNTLSNTYNYNIYRELFDQNISIFSFYFKNSVSITNDDIKLSERLYIPSGKLRGFERGRVGPKDGNDFIGGNYISAINLSSTIPQIFQNSENTNFLFFMDLANIWGIDYDSSIDDTNKIRSSIGIGIDWFTPVGPLNFSLAQPLSKSDTDITETFRFNLGTTF